MKGKKQKRCHLRPGDMIVGITGWATNHGHPLIYLGQKSHNGPHFALLHDGRRVELVHPRWFRVVMRAQDAEESG